MSAHTMAEEAARKRKLAENLMHELMEDGAGGAPPKQQRSSHSLQSSVSRDDGHERRPAHNCDQTGRHDDRRRKEHSLPSEVRSLRHKVGTLNECNRKMELELELERRRFHRRRTALRESKELAKAGFLRSAAALQGQTEDHRAASAKCNANIAAKDPEIAELRAKLLECERHLQERREALTAEKEERLAALREELDRLTGAAPKEPSKPALMAQSRQASSAGEPP